MTAPFITHLVEQQAAELRDLFDECRVDIHDDQVDMAIRLVLCHVAQCLDTPDPVATTAVLIDAYRDLLGSGIYG